MKKRTFLTLLLTTIFCIFLAGAAFAENWLVPNASGSLNRFSADGTTHPLKYLDYTIVRSESEPTGAIGKKLEAAYVNMRSFEASSSRAIVPNPWHIAEISDMIQGHASDTSIFGNVFVFVFDTGVRGTHETFVRGSGSNVSADLGYNTTSVDSRDWGDVHGHGTAVASVIGGLAASGGVCPYITIVPVRIAGSNATTSLADMAAAIDYVVDMKKNVLPTGSKVIVNMSYNMWDEESGSSETAFADMLNLLDSEDVLFVTSAGNNARNADVPEEVNGTVCFPTILENPSHVSVAATTNVHEKASFSNYGYLTTETSAPGEDMYMAGHSSNTGYVIGNGTSFASPYVAACAAYAWAMKPEMTSRELRNFLIRVNFLDSFADAHEPANARQKYYIPVMSQTIINPRRITQYIVDEGSLQEPLGNYRPSHSSVTNNRPYPPYGLTYDYDTRTYSWMQRTAANVTPPSTFTLVIDGDVVSRDLTVKQYVLFNSSGSDSGTSRFEASFAGLSASVVPDPGDEGKVLAQSVLSPDIYTMGYNVTLPEAPTPTPTPTITPTSTPTPVPSVSPSISPTVSPTITPTVTPTPVPTPIIVTEEDEEEIEAVNPVATVITNPTVLTAEQKKILALSNRDGTPITTPVVVGEGSNAVTVTVSGDCCVVVNGKTIQVLDGDSYSKDYIEQVLLRSNGALFGKVNPDNVTQMPAFTSSIESGKEIAVVSTRMSFPSSKLPATFKDIFFLKARPLGQPSLAFTFVDSVASNTLGDGRFWVRNSAGTLMKSTDIPIAGEAYFFSFCIRDGGNYDVDNVKGNVTDPAMVAVKSSISPTVVPTVSPTHNSGGGCSAGLWQTAILLLAVPLLLERRFR